QPRRAGLLSEMRLADLQPDGRAGGPADAHPRRDAGRSRGDGAAGSDLDGECTELGGARPEAATSSEGPAAGLAGRRCKTMSYTGRCACGAVTARIAGEAI